MEILIKKLYQNIENKMFYDESIFEVIKQKTLK